MNVDKLKPSKLGKLIKDLNIDRKEFSDQKEIDILISSVVGSRKKISFDDF